MGGWILVNLFLLAVVPIGAGCTFVAFSLVKAAHLSLDNEPLAYIAAAILALVATGWLVKHLHGFIQRRIG